MSDICVPNSALESEEEFRNWYLRMTARLFPKIQKVYLPTIDQKLLSQELSIMFERILSWANYVFNGDWSIIPYKSKDNGLNKKKHSNRKITDVMSVSCAIMVEHYDTEKGHLCSSINVNRSSFYYYMKRHNSNCMYKEYVKKYNELKINLKNEGIISTAG